ncbi:MAG: type II toxin-antitoxin system PemK/MazF family toxin [Planctomycetales bacterium]
MRIRRGEVYWLKPDATGKQRPVVIISREDLNGGHSLVGVPFYSQQLEKRTQQAWCVFFAAGEGGLTKDCVAKTDEVSMIDKLDVDLQRGPLGIFDAA